MINFSICSGITGGIAAFLMLLSWASSEEQVCRMEVRGQGGESGNGTR